MPRKTQQLQIRVTPEEKQAIRHQAERAGQDLSTYVLAQALGAGRSHFREAIRGLTDTRKTRFWLSELNDLLTALSPAEFDTALETGEFRALSPFLQNYVAAMVEHAAHRKAADPPAWVREVEPLEEPYFAVPLASLREHLLIASPVAFKRRNLFIDSSIGDRV